MAFKSILGAVLCLLMVNAYSSSIWFENNALDTVAGAEFIEGIDSLTEIHGTLGTNFLDIADVYRFQILPENVSFSLSIQVLSEPTNGRHPNLFLFDGNGNGIQRKMCCGSGAGSKTTLSVSGLIVGEYLLGISQQNLVPFGVNTLGNEDQIFDIDDRPFEIAGSLTEFGGSWSGVPMEYQISISGAAPLTTVPIPSAVWLFGSGLIGLIGLARRKA
jgi:hypothetical protein